MQNCVNSKQSNFSQKNKQGNLHLQHTSANILRQRESRNVAAKPHAYAVVTKACPFAVNKCDIKYATQSAAGFALASAVNLTVCKAPAHKKYNGTLFSYRKQGSRKNSLSQIFWRLHIFFFCFWFSCLLPIFVYFLVFCIRFVTHLCRDIDAEALWFTQAHARTPTHTHTLMHIRRARSFCSAWKTCFTFRFSFLLPSLLFNAFTLLLCAFIII